MPSLHHQLTEDLEQTKKALKESEQRFQSLLNNLHVGVYRTAPDGSFLFVNDVLAQMCGYTNIDEVLNTKVYDHYARKKDREKVFHDIIKTGQFRDRETMFIRKDGSLFWGKTISSAIKSPEGKLLYFDGTIEDITRKKEAEAAIKESESFFADTLDDLLTCVGVLDKDGTILFANNTSLELIDLEADDVLGINYFQSEWWKYSDKTRQIIKECVERCAKGETIVFEGELIKKDGTRLWISQSMHSIFDEDGIVRYIIPEGRDITQQKISEEALKKAHDELEKRVVQRTSELAEANKKLLHEINDRKKIEKQLKISLQEKEILLSEIHHRVKNNLQIVSSLLGMAAMRHTNQETINVLNESRNRIQTMSMIHEQLCESENLQFMDMPTIITKIASGIAELSEAYENNITYDIKVDVPTLSLSQAITCSLIINELLSNVQKHAYPNKKKGSVLIKMHMTDMDNVLLKVKDNGVGISKEIDIDKIESLGLKLVVILAKEQLKGKIDFFSQEGTEIAISFKKNTHTGS